MSRNMISTTTHTQIVTSIVTSVLNGKAIEALRMSQEALRSHGEDALFLRLFIDSLCKLDAGDVSTLVLEWSEKRTFEQPALCEPAAMLANHIGSKQQALAIIQRSIQTKTCSIELLILAARILLEYGETDQAKLLLMDVLKATPSPEARKLLQATDLSFKKASARDMKLVLFVADSPKARLLRMAQILRESDWRVILLTGSELDFSTQNIFESVEQYSNSEHALYLSQSYHPRLIHVFSPMADVTCRTFIQEKRVPVVFDAYDFTEGMILDPSLEEVTCLQKWCMENADALTCRDLRPRYLWKHRGYRKSEKTIFFSDYCLNKPIDLNARPSPQEELHVVSCGYVATGRQSAEQDWGYLEVGRSLTQQGIHFHLYPHPMQAKSQQFEELFRDFSDEASTNSLFHFHKPVPMDAVQQEISKYHFGINIFSPKVFERVITSYSDVSLRYCSSARIIEYLDAGLALLSHNSNTFQYHLMKRYGLAVHTTPDLLKNGRGRLIEFLQEPTLSARISKARASYSLGRHGKRLMDFYSSFD